MLAVRFWHRSGRRVSKPYLCVHCRQVRPFPAVAPAFSSDQIVHTQFGLGTIVAVGSVAEGSAAGAEGRG